MKKLSQRVRGGLQVEEWVDSPFFFKGAIDGYGELPPYAPRENMRGSPYFYESTPVKETAARYYGIVRCQWCGCNIPEALAVCSQCMGPQGMRI